MKPKSTPLYTLSYPIIDPVALSIGPISIHWYGLAYIAGIFTGYTCVKRILQKISFSINLSDLITYVMIGIIIGGRLGYVIFYDPIYYAQNPLDIMAIWKGGMAFHGGAIGAFVGTLLFCNKTKVSWIKGADILAFGATPGLFFGRIANFINGELYGRPTNVSWGMVFPNAGETTRHPSQLYEAGLEGILLFCILAIIIQRYYKPGRVFSVFVIGYAMLRFLVEFTRQPDTHLGLFAFQLSMGQYLSLLMIGVGVGWAYYVKAK